jgi:hypothetical protein
MYGVLIAQVPVAFIGAVWVSRVSGFSGRTLYAALVVVWVLGAVAGTIGWLATRSWNANQQFDTPEVDDVG